LPVRGEPIQEKARARLRTLRQFGAADQIESEHIEPPRARPRVRVVEDRQWVSRHHRLDQGPPRRLSGFALQPTRRNRPHQLMQPNRLRRYRRVALVSNCLAIDEREGPQRHDRFVEPILRELGRQRMAELLARLGEQKQRDRLGCQQRRVDDERLSGGMELRGFIDGESECLDGRQAILDRRVYLDLEQPYRPLARRSSQAV